MKWHNLNPEFSVCFQYVLGRWLGQYTKCGISNHSSNLCETKALGELQSVGGGGAVEGIAWCR